MASIVGGEFNNVWDDPKRRSPLLPEQLTFDDVTDQVCRVAEAKSPPAAWWIAFAISAAVFTAIIASLIPGWRAARLDPCQAFKEV